MTASQPSTTQPVERPTKVRTFLAIELGADLQPKFEDLLTRLKKGAHFTPAHPKWVDAGNVHLTLKFFGDTTPEQRTRISEALRPVASRHAAHGVPVRGLGVFPHPRQPRVIWIGVRRARALHALQLDVEEALSPLGWEEEDREFAPHLTLARIKHQRGAKALMDVVASHREWELGQWAIREMVLFQSTLRREGATYTPLERFPLKE